ncbi:MAG: trypsin-like peptidase domain-containing protein [Oligoflexia bacterium]|nr:trypsin-like peptidase domain-containing protein [Oligoflexia bacterium]MBF0366075.1 trypsin-like peptidase domain-containing protein [Oligoflexia bacterium]
MRANKKTFRTFTTVASSLFIMLFSVACGKQIKDEMQRKVEQEESLNNETSSKSIVGALNWVGIANVTYNAEVGKNLQAVGLIDIPAEKSRCTAFLISEDMLMTNWHCFPTVVNTRGAKFYPTYIEDGAEKGEAYACEELVVTYEPLDVAVLKCSGTPGKKYGVVTFEYPGKIHEVNESIYVIHQNCDYWNESECAPTKKYSPGKIVTAGSVPAPARELDLFYDADTLGGSSGSPVFSANEHKVIALHHNGHGQNYSSKGRGDRNSGVAIDKVIDYLRANVGALKNLGGVFVSTPLLTAKGEIATETEVDYYDLTIAKASKIKILLTYSANIGDLDLYVTDRNKKVLAKSESSNDSDSISGTIQAGRYYIAVKGYQGARGTYDLTAE